jgi:hypothetical protein
MTFYDGIVDAEMLKREVVKVKRYIEDVESLYGGRGVRTVTFYPGSSRSHIIF